MPNNSRVKTKYRRKIFMTAEWRNNGNKSFGDSLWFEKKKKICGIGILKILRNYIKNFSQHMIINLCF